LCKAGVTVRLEAYRGARLEPIRHNIEKYVFELNGDCWQNELTIFIMFLEKIRHVS
jgi:hypothetical protein